MLSYISRSTCFEKINDSTQLRERWILYHSCGIRRLYPSFGLGLIGQTLSATSESGLSQVMAGVIAKANKSNRWLWTALATILSKGLALAINMPLYPLYRTEIGPRSPYQEINEKHPLF
jgi:hypothetical protein